MRLTCLACVETRACTSGLQFVYGECSAGPDYLFKLIYMLTAHDRALALQVVPDGQHWLLRVCH